MRCKPADSAAARELPAFPAIARRALETLQVNVGYRCNQACTHCHVDAGPKRTEMMSADTAALVVDYAISRAVGIVDLTGGAPELNDNFRAMVSRLRAAGIQVIDRCNLTILTEPGQEDLAAFLAEQGVTVVASLPCYQEENVDRQRGSGVFKRSIRGLELLNEQGYGAGDGRLELNLVFNPQGARLPPDQAALEADYKRHLEEAYGIRFDRLLAICNMPIKRFAHELERDGLLDSYLATLVSAHHDDNLAAVMCRSLVSVDWQGYLYDCDFNQMLNIPLGGAGKRHLRELGRRADAAQPIAVGMHCYGCTAGQGSSCGGALA
ncbi:MAG: arsenosugar biosynthesis radical SAM protein ArsS [Gammaproteobacteria bacterium]|nr:arsenosugar biosynthesis radical SAM protein ArsS [Gammaproteobacteria bacterium]